MRKMPFFFCIQFFSVFLHGPGKQEYAAVQRRCVLRRNECFLSAVPVNLQPRSFGCLDPERKFDSPGALKEQIVLDISGANKIFGQNYCEVTR